MEHGDWLEFVLITVWGVLFGVVGGLVQIVRRGALSWRWALGQIVVSGFCGFLLHAILDGFGSVPPGWIAAACGIAGSCGGALLDALQTRMLERVRRRR